MLRLASALFATSVPLLSLAIICVARISFPRVFSVNRLVARTSLVIWNYLVMARNAAQHHASLLGDLRLMLALGSQVGLCLGSAMAVLFVASRSAERTLLPVAMILRSVPLVAMMPFIVLVFGHGLLPSRLIGTIVAVFKPC